MRLSAEALDRMRDAVGDDAEVLADILESFVEEVDGLLAALSEGARVGQAPVMGRAAHTLKSSARDLGDAELAELCATLEHEARQGTVDRAEERAVAIAAASLALKQDVAAYVRALREGASS
jgi:HPt (histidine-containing phosphotransfer) domain-containing protein